MPTLCKKYQLFFMPKFSRKRNNIYLQFLIISTNRAEAGIWNPYAWNTQTRSSYIVKQLPLMAWWCKEPGNQQLC